MCAGAASGSCRGMACALLAGTGIAIGRRAQDARHSASDMDCELAVARDPRTQLPWHRSSARQREATFDCQRPQIAPPCLPELRRKELRIGQL